MKYFNFNCKWLLFIVILLLWNIKITDTLMNKTEKHQDIKTSPPSVDWPSSKALGMVSHNHHWTPSTSPIISAEDETLMSSEWSSTQTLVSHSHDPWGSGSHQISPTTSKSRRSKRHVAHLYNMVSCATGCDPLSYKGYGCYCGFLGSGYVVDGIDSCCKMHDWCYQTANCPMFLEYFIPYLWKCYRGHRPLCAIEHGMWGGAGSCAQRLCECDRQLSMCLRRYPCPHTKALCHSSPFRLLQNVFML